MIKEAIAKLIDRQELTEQEAAQVMNEIMEGNATHSQIAAFLTALRMKGETKEEVTGFVQTMREKAMKVRVSEDIEVVDTCGTGGDKLNTFNISTCVVFVAAGAGVPIAKHGNRAASSKCGSADVLEELGVNIALSPEQVSKCIAETGVGFMFAPTMHPAMKHAVTPRKDLGVRTIFNLLGPMTNPAGAKRQVIGVFQPEYTELVANVLHRVGTKFAMVFHGLDGLDEISTLGTTVISELRDGKVVTKEFSVESFGLKRASAQDLAVQNGSVAASAEALLEVLEGKKGAKRDIVLLNAAAALVVAEKAPDFSIGIELAAQTLDSGKAMKKLQEFRAYSSGVGALV